MNVEIDVRMKVTTDDPVGIVRVLLGLVSVYPALMTLIDLLK